MPGEGEIWTLYSQGDSHYVSTVHCFLSRMHWIVRPLTDRSDACCNPEIFQLLSRSVWN